MFNLIHSFSHPFNAKIVFQLLSDVRSIANRIALIDIKLRMMEASDFAREHLRVALARSRARRSRPCANLLAVDRDDARLINCHVESTGRLIKFQSETTEDLLFGLECRPCGRGVLVLSDNQIRSSK